MRSCLAQHTLLDFHDCDPLLLKHASGLKPLLFNAVLAGRGTIVNSLFHDFSPCGVSGVILIAESHVTIHTWPEHAYAAVDIFSCSHKLSHKAIRDYLKRALSSRHVTGKTSRRGSSFPPPLPVPDGPRTPGPESWPAGR